MLQQTLCKFIRHHSEVQAMSKRNIFLLLILAAPVLAGPVLVTEELSAGTRSVLVLEMQAIAEAMGRIHTALVTGDHAGVATDARNIEASFVLNKQLTAAQRHEIHTRMPGEFLAADQAFHQLAGELAEVAERRDLAQERALFNAMSEACESCHVRFAGKRFAGLSKFEPAGE